MLADVPERSSRGMYEGKHIHFSEVDRKPLCSYSPKLCKQRRLSGYALCIRHVLEDRSAPFRQCQYVAKYNNQRCTNPIPKAHDRKFCNSHLQVMGVLPKKVRKRKQDALESLALNITLPALSPRSSNGGEQLPPSLACLLPLHPFTFCRAEKVQGAFQKKTNNRLGQNPKVRHKGPDPVQFCPDPAGANSPSPSPAPLRSPVPAAPKLAPPSRPCVTPPAFLAPPLCPPRPQPTPSCKPAATPAGAPHSSLKPDACPKPPPDRSAGPGPAHVPPPPPPQGRTAMTRPAVPRALGSGRAPCLAPCLAPCITPCLAPCLAQLQRLLQEERHKELSLHSGPGWAEDGAEEEEDVGNLGRMASLQYQRLQERYSLDRAGCRGERLAWRCAYLRQKCRILRREESALRRQSTSQQPLRQALLQAAKLQPLHTALLIQQPHTEPTSAGVESPWQRGSESSGLCAAVAEGVACCNQALPFTRHCFPHILQNRSQQLFASCTARFADGAQCSVPVFHITHQTPLCQEHAKKMDNCLRGDVSRRAFQQQRVERPGPLRRNRPPALTRKHRRRGGGGPARRPQKPIPPALPQGNLTMPTVLSLPTHTTGIRSPLTPDLSTDEFPDDITDDITDDISVIPHDLELNQEDFSDVLPRLPDDLQDFDLFEGKNSELLPTSEEAEELVRVLQAMGSYPESLVCLSELDPAEGGGGAGGGGAELLSARLSAESLSRLLQHSEDGFPPSPLSPQPPLTPPSSVPTVHPPGAAPPTDRPFPQTQTCAPPAETLVVEGGMGGQDPPHGTWGILPPLTLTDPPSFPTLIGPENWSTPPGPAPSDPCQLSVALSAPPTDLLSPKHAPLLLANHCGIPADLRPLHSSPAPPVGRR